MSDGVRVVSDNSQKTPLAQSLTRLAAARALDQDWLRGRGYPASVVRVVSSGVVEVKFEVDSAPWSLPTVVVPIVGWQYLQMPVQVGELGRCVPSDARLGGVTGLGSAIADLSNPGNLGALAWEPLGSVDWPAVVDPTAVTVNQNVLVRPDGLGFFNNPVAAQQSITGALSAVTDPAAKAVLTSIISALAEAAGYSLVKDETT